MLYHDRLQEIIHEFDLLIGKADLGAFGGKSQKRIKLISTHEHLVEKPSPLSPHALTVIGRWRGAGGLYNVIYSHSLPAKGWWTRGGIWWRRGVLAAGILFLVFVLVPVGNLVGSSSSKVKVNVNLKVI